MTPTRPPSSSHLPFVRFAPESGARPAPEATPEPGAVPAASVREAVEAERAGARCVATPAGLGGDVLHAILASVRIAVVAHAADAADAAPAEVRRGALIDLDGTVLDSMGVWGDVDRDFLHRHGIAVTDAILSRLGSFVHLREAAEFFHDECGIPGDPETICGEFRDLLADRYFRSIPLLPGVRESLERLHTGGVRTALVTATDERLARAALRRNGVEHLFDHFFCDVTKRDPASLLLPLDALGTGLRETVVYDDVPSILDLARSTGFAAAAPTLVSPP